MSLSRDDIVLGRALLAWGLVDRGRLMACAEEVQRYAAHGQPVTLGQVLVQRGLLSVDRYQAIVSRLHQVYMQSPSASPQVQQATQQVPFMNRAGRYTKSFQVPSHLDDSGVERAVAGWQQTAGQVTNSSSQLDAGAPAAPSPAPAPAPAPPAPVVVDEEQEKRRPDRPIRRRLGVAPGQERFAIAVWTVEEFLGAGNWGIVYRVTRQGDAASYALKVLKQLNPSDQVRQRFIQEARTMAKLSHAGIVRVHDAGVVKGLLWFVMDLLQGSNLDELIDEGGPLSVPEALRVMDRLCSAVAYAHSRGILHRDLKPENVVMAGGREPVLTDFGLAKDTESGLNLTAEGQRLGTPFYMAPELLIEAGKATAQSEVYALGAILYKLLTGKVPFEAKGIVKLMDKIEEGKPPPLRQLCPAAPKELERLCLSCLDRKPAKRPRTVAELMQGLAKLA